METTTFDIEQRWPELFEGLTKIQHDAVIDTLASDWHEGWLPNRDQVELFTAFVRGDIDQAEFDRRAAAQRAAARPTGRRVS